MKLRIAVIWVNLGPYHIARLNALTKDDRLEVVAFELAAREATRQWRVTTGAAMPVETLSRGSYQEADPRELAGRLSSRLDSLQPDAVAVGGYSEVPMRRAARWAKEHNRIAVLMSDSNQKDRARRWLLEKMKGRWIRRYVDAAFVAGSESARYLNGLGLPMDRIWRGYDVVDNEYFELSAETVRKEEASWRAALGLPTQYFLYVGRLAPEKNLRALIEAYERYKACSRNDSWGLVLVGDGPTKAGLEAHARGFGITGIRWVEFMQLEQLAPYYALASCLILPSISEPWGLVVNEAMASGLPILISDRCGAATDLLWPGVNGYTFAHDDTKSLAWLLGHMASKSVDLSAMGAASRGLVAAYTPDTWARALTDCVVSLRLRGANGGTV